MKVYAPADFSFVTALERPVEKGEEIDVDDEVGAGLVHQGWDTARKKAARKAARRTRRPAPVRRRPTVGQHEHTTPDQGVEDAPGAAPIEEQ
jgi:hypothetical protein